MTTFVSCPACQFERVSVCSYDSMMMLKADTALFSLRCPECGARISTLQTIPDQLHDEIVLAAAESGAGMGRK